MSTIMLDLTTIKVMRKIYELKILLTLFSSDHDHHHFDNPVYSTYRNSSSLSGTPLNNARLHNRIVKNINSDREKASAAASSCPRASSSFIEEDDISDTTSERGIVPINTYLYQELQFIILKHHLILTKLVNGRLTVS